VDCNTGDVVEVSTMAFCYQDSSQSFFTNLEQKSSIGLVLKRKEFAVDTNDPNDCEDISDGSCIQNPQWVYTILCKGVKIEALDIDIIKKVEG